MLQALLLLLDLINNRISAHGHRFNIAWYMSPYLVFGAYRAPKVLIDPARQPLRSIQPILRARILVRIMPSVVAQVLSVAAKCQFFHIILRFSSFAVIVVIEIHGNELATVFHG